jgi:hypothetical protein
VIMCVDLVLRLGEKSVEKQVTPSTRISALRAMISRTLGVSVRKRRVRIVDGEEGEGMEGMEVGEGDGGRDVGWFISGRKGVVIVE